MALPKVISLSPRIWHSPLAKNLVFAVELPPVEVRVKTSPKFTKALLEITTGSCAAFSITRVTSLAFAL